MVFSLSVSLTQFRQDSGCLVTNRSPRIPERERERRVEDRKVECFVSFVWILVTVFTFFFDCFLCIFSAVCSLFLHSTLPSSPPPSSSSRLLTLNESQALYYQGRKEGGITSLRFPIALLLFFFSSIPASAMLNTYQQYMSHNPSIIHYIWAISSHTNNTSPYLNNRIVCSPVTLKTTDMTTGVLVTDILDFHYQVIKVV